MTLLHTAALLLCMSAPFEDARGRFTVDVPEGWVFSPQPGDTQGAAFSGNLDGIPASAAIRTWQFDTPQQLATLVRDVAAAVNREPGYRLLVDEPVTLAGAAAVRRRFVLYINGDPKWSKMVEQRIAVFGQRGFVIHAETVAEAFGSFEQQFDSIFSSFRPWVAPSMDIDSSALSTPTTGSFVGTWLGAGFTVELSPSGVVLINHEEHGRYLVDAGVLILTMSGRKSVIRYHWIGDKLRLRGGRFGDGVLLDRQSPKRP